jgi:tetratricopeptide (TPR) repeat protein
MSISHMLKRYSRIERPQQCHLFGLLAAVSILVHSDFAASADDLPGPASSQRALALSVLTPRKKQVHQANIKSTKINKTTIQRKIQESYPRTHFEKGQLLKQKHDLTNALIEFLKATQEDPQLASGFYEQALIFKDRGFKKLAQSSLQQALRIKPNYVEARLLLATIRLEQGNLGEAVQELSKSIAVASENANQDRATATATAESSPSSALLGTLPVILQSIHDVLKVPSMGMPDKPAKEINHEVDGHGELARNEKPGSKLELKGLWKGRRHRELEQKQAEIGSTKKDETAAPLLALADSKRDLPTEIQADATDHTKNENDGGAGKKKSKQRRTKAFTDVWNKLAQASHETTHSGRKQKGDDGEGDPGQTALTSQTDGNNLARLTRGLGSTRAEIPPVTPKKEVENSEATDSDSRERLDGELSSENGARHQATAKAAAEENNSGNNRNDLSTTARSASNGSVNRSALDRSGSGNAGERSGSCTEPEQQTVAEGVDPTAAPTPFNAAQRPPAIAGILANFIGLPAVSQEGITEVSRAKPKVVLDHDVWANKLKYFVEHGTSSLKDGEAFMFSEETGEAALFLADGSTVRRIVAQPKDNEELLKLRRPDILNPEEMLYNLSLLGKLIPKSDAAANGLASTFPAAEKQGASVTNDESAFGSYDQRFSNPSVIDGTQSFWGWLKNVLRF